MPIVFVHGVNNRLGDGYTENKESRDAFLKKIVGPVLIPDAGSSLQVISPYWGSLGVSFAWDMAALPDPAARYEKFGADDAASGRTGVAASSILSPDTKASDSILDIARKDLPAAVELLFAAQMAGADSPEEAESLADAYSKAMAYIRKANPKDLEWLNAGGITKDNFADILGAKIQQERGEAFGGASWSDKLKEGLGRVAGAIPDFANGLIVEKSRRAANARVTRFVGDAFIYLVSRERRGIEAPIIQEVLKALDQAEQIRNKTGSKDTKLIVISHSFGGEIMYDILTKYRTDLQVDCWVTIGSQVGLFEEMKLFETSDSKLPGRDANKRALAGTVDAWPNIKRWLNVFDLNDVFSYRAESIFSGVEDFKYDTGYTTLQAHGGYFERPSFYERLADRLKA